MQYRRSYLFAVAAASLAFACGDNHPTSPSLTAVSPDASASVRGRPGRPGATLTGAVDETVGTAVIDGVIRVTRLENSPVGLLVSGVISGTANGQAFTQTFTRVPSTLSGGGGATAAVSGPSTQAIASCDVLLLDLGPLHLDILGLVVDLSQVVLDIDAEAGAGNLLGNLLCAVVGLLDGVALLPVLTNLLEQINAILGALG
jgi:hypothetical protein